MTVVHTQDNSWLVGDGVNDPNLPGAVVVAGISHIADADASVAELTTLPLGHIAELRPDLHLFSADKFGQPEKYPPQCEFHRADFERDKLPWPGASMDAGMVGSPQGKGLFIRAISESGAWMGLGMSAMTPLARAEQSLPL